jgi:hypothetical protein
MRTITLAAAAVILMMLIFFAAQCRSEGEAGTRWAVDPIWDDGKAEISAYQAVAMRYGKPREYIDYQIVVKEPFSKRLLVKADPDHDPDDVTTVIKLNRVLNYQTGIYAYHQMQSFFFDVEDMQPLKWTLAHFEWCGNTFKMFTRRERQTRLETHTYWDGDADQLFDLEFDSNTVFYDQLPVWLRAQRLEPGSSRELRVYPTELSSRGPRPTATQAVLTVPGQEEITLADGSRRSALLVQLGIDGGLHRFWFEPEFPRRLLGWETPDGERGRLRWSQRLPYWQLNQPGDERYLNLEPDAPVGGAPAAPEPKAGGSVEGDEAGVEDPGGVEAPLPLEQPGPRVPEVGQPAGPVELDEP